MLAVSSARPPAGPGVVAEPKYDGFRTLITVAGDGRCRVVSRHGRHWTDRFPELARITTDLGRSVVLDGETVVLGDDGRPSFERLSARLTGAAAGTDRPRSSHSTCSRSTASSSSIGPGVNDDGCSRPCRWMVSEPWPPMVCDDAAALFEATARLGVEGVVAKLTTAHYVCGHRSKSWVKVKHRGDGWMDLAGWRPPAGRRPGMVSVREDVAFVGTAMVALGETERAVLHAFIARYGRPSGPWITLPPGAQVYVEYTERSVRGRLREAIIRDLRPAVPVA